MISLYSVSGSGNRQGDRRVSHYTCQILAGGIVDAARKYEADNPGMVVWNVTHKGKVDGITETAYQILSEQVVGR